MPPETSTSGLTDAVASTAAAIEEAHLQGVDEGKAETEQEAGSIVDNAASAVGVATAAVALAETQAAKAELDAAVTIAEKEQDIAWLKDKISMLESSLIQMQTSQTSTAEMAAVTMAEIAALRAQLTPPTLSEAEVEPGIQIVDPVQGVAADAEGPAAPAHETPEKVKPIVRRWI